MYVPAACTPVAQPVDLGVAGKFKVSLRFFYGMETTDTVVTQLELKQEAKLDFGGPYLKKKLLEWSAEALHDMNADRSTVKRAWEKIGCGFGVNLDVPELQGGENKGIHLAFDDSFQNRAVSEAARLFPNQSFASSEGVDNSKAEESPGASVFDVDSDPENDEEEQAAIIRAVKDRRRARAAAAATV